MVAPVVLITVAALFVNGLLAFGNEIADRIFALNREHLGILRGPDGEVLDEDSFSVIDRERLTQIRHELPLIMTRVWRVHSAVVLIWVGRQ